MVVEVVVPFLDTLWDGGRRGGGGDGSWCCVYALLLLHPALSLWRCQGWDRAGCWRSSIGGRRTTGGVIV